MQNTAVAAGATDVSVILRAFDVTTGAAKTDLVYDTTDLAISYKRGATGTTTTAQEGEATEPVTLASETTAHADWGFLHLESGAYRVDLPDAAFATGSPTPPWVLITAEVVGDADVLFTAAFVDLTGSDPRAAAVTTTTIADEVQTRTIAAVTTVNGLAANTVTATAIASNAITDAKIATGAITAAKFAAGAIDAASIASNAITDAKIASNAITAAKIATDAITDAKIAASAVTKVADGVVDAEIAVLPTFNRTGANGNTGLQIGTTTFDITTNANAEPIVQIDTPPSP